MTTAESETPQVEIHGRRAGSQAKGRRTFLTSEGETVYVEQFALEHYLSQGCQGVWSENFFWWQAMMLLYWDVVYAPIPDVYYPDWPFPSERQDLPQDMFRGGFYKRRKRLIQSRHAQLMKTGFLRRSAHRPRDELVKAWNKHRGKMCRLMGTGDDAWSMFTRDQLAWGVSQLTPSQIVTMNERLLLDFTENRRGLPDLFVISGDGPKFVEVKQPRERVSDVQTAWHGFIVQQMGLPVEICRVRSNE